MEGLSCPNKRPFSRPILPVSRLTMQRLRGQGTEDARTSCRSPQVSPPDSHAAWSTTALFLLSPHPPLSPSGPGKFRAGWSGWDLLRASSEHSNQCGCLNSLECALREQGTTLTVPRSIRLHHHISPSLLFTQLRRPPRRSFSPHPPLCPSPSPLPVGARIISPAGARKDASNLHRESRRRGHRDLASRCGPPKPDGEGGRRGLFEVPFRRSRGRNEFRSRADATPSAVEPERLSRAGWMHPLLTPSIVALPAPHSAPPPAPPLLSPSPSPLPLRGEGLPDSEGLAGVTQTARVHRAHYQHVNSKQILCARCAST